MPNAQTTGITRGHSTASRGGKRVIRERELHQGLVSREPVGESSCCGAQQLHFGYNPPPRSIAKLTIWIQRPGGPDHQSMVQAAEARAKKAFNPSRRETVAGEAPRRKDARV